MAEHALSYVIALVILGNVSVVAALATIVVVVPRMHRRRPAHRAATAPLRLSAARRPAPARRAAAPRTRAA